MNMLDINFRTVTTEGPGNALRVDDGLTIVRTLHIGCKGEGRPKADIMWYELDQIASRSTDLGSMDRVKINDTERNDVVITEPREGRSVLSISLQPSTPICRRFICEASNLGGVAVGGVDICTQSISNLIIGRGTPGGGGGEQPFDCLLAREQDIISLSIDSSA